MPIVITPESELGKELAQWDTPKRLGGKRCDGFEPYPKMLYKAFPNPQKGGKVQCMDTAELDYVEYAGNQAKAMAAQHAAQAFTNRCTTIVKSEGEEDLARGQGWRTTPAEAVEHYEAVQQGIAQAAAETAHAAQRMTATAKAELAAADAETHEHVTDVPKPRRGRPRKPVQEAS